MSEQKLETMRCPDCGGVILAGVARCKYCLASLPKNKAPALGKLHAKNPLVAVLLSILMPGLGQYYCGKRKKAIIVIFVFVVIAGLFYWLVFPWPAAIVAAWAGYDAYHEAGKT
jgi:TM2 domain-containing membrane protein YozV